MSTASPSFAAAETLQEYLEWTKAGGESFSSSTCRVRVEKARRPRLKIKKISKLFQKWKNSFKIEHKKVEFFSKKACYNQTTKSVRNIKHFWNLPILDLQWNSVDGVFVVVEDDFRVDSPRLFVDTDRPGSWRKITFEKTSLENMFLKIK